MKWTGLWGLLMTATLSAQTYNPITYDAWQNQLKSIEGQDGKLFYWEGGHGPSIVLVHGVPTSSWLYRHIAPQLVASGFHVVIPDMAGYGKSSPWTTSDSPYEQQARGLQLLHSSLNLNGSVLVVHDAGGPWCWTWLLDKAPDLSGLVLLNTIIHTKGFHPPVRPSQNSFMHRMLKWAYRTKWMARSIVKSTMKKGIEKRKLDKTEKEGYTKPLDHGAGHAMGEFFGTFSVLDELTNSVRPYIGKRKIPVMAIWGEKDPFLVGQEQLPYAMRELGLANDDVHLLGGCGHFIQEEAPDEISALITEFTQKTNGR